MSWLSMDRDLAASPRVRAAMALLATAAVLVIVTTVRAIRIDPPDVVVPQAIDNTNGKTKFARAVQVDAEQVVQKDIFAVDRTPPAERYPMPGDEKEPAPVVNAGPPPARPTVLGTAVGSDGSAFATAQVAGIPPRIVRVGDHLGIYTVVAITRGTVTFRAADIAPFQIIAP